MKLRIAVLTGIRAYPIVRMYSSKALETYGDKVSIEVIKLPIGVMGLATASTLKHIIENIPEVKSLLKQFDVVLVSGRVEGDVGVLEDVIKRPVFKGSIDPSLLPETIGYLLEGGTLSKKGPAEEILLKNRLEQFKSSYRTVVSNIKPAFSIGPLKVPLRGPPVLLAAETPVTIPVSKVREYSSWYEGQGAEIVIVGIPVEEDLDSSIKRVREAERGLNKAVLAVDSMKAKVIESGFEMGAELALSLHPGNIEAFLPYRREKAFVVIPTDPLAGDVYDAESGLPALKQTIAKAGSYGYEKLIADLILAPPCTGLLQSIESYLKFSSEVGSVPFMMGFANVTELFDVDSIGVNAILSALAVEVGASLVLVSEESWKARYSVVETKISLMMASVARQKGMPPVDLGIDMLVLKSKNPSRQSGVLLKAKERVEVNGESLKEELDRWGHVVIEVDHETGRIIACVFKAGAKTPERCYYGRSALNILKRIISDNPELSKQHAGYLGVELEKAEIALATGKQYTQDRPLEIGYSSKLELVKEVLEGLQA